MESDHVTQPNPLYLLVLTVTPQHDHSERARPGGAEIQERNLRVLPGLAGRVFLPGHPGVRPPPRHTDHQVSQAASRSTEKFIFFCPPVALVGKLKLFDILHQKAES